MRVKKVARSGRRPLPPLRPRHKKTGVSRYHRQARAGLRASGACVARVAGIPPQPPVRCHALCLGNGKRRLPIHVLDSREKPRLQISDELPLKPKIDRAVLILPDLRRNYHQRTGWGVQTTPIALDSSRHSHHLPSESEQTEDNEKRKSCETKQPEANRVENPNSNQPNQNIRNSHVYDTM